jgi:hypothetical protein
MGQIIVAFRDIAWLREEELLRVLLLLLSARILLLCARILRRLLLLSMCFSLPLSYVRALSFSVHPRWSVHAHIHTD